MFKIILEVAMYIDSEIWLGIVGSGASTSVTVTLSGSGGTMVQQQIFVNIQE